MEEKVAISVKSIIEKLNLFTLLQVIWLIEIYYLGINVSINILGGLKVFDFKIPAQVIYYNEKILGYLDNYKSLVSVLVVAFFMCGVAGVFVRRIEILSKNKLINIYADFGVYCGIWLAIIWATYSAYEVTGYYFLTLPAIIWGIFEIKEKAIEWLNNKGMTIGSRY